MAIFHHDDLALHYEDCGEGVPFLFQHGFGVSYEQPLGLATPPAGVRLICMDFRGHGRSDLGPEDELGFVAYGDDMLALLQHIGLEQAVVGGISMGAASALNFALRYPGHTRGLILSRPAWLDGPMAPEIREIFRSVATLINRYGAENGRQRFLQSSYYTSLQQEAPSVAQSFVGYFTDPRSAETLSKFERLPADAPSWDRHTWKEIEVPTLILASKQDPLHPYAYGLEYAARIPQAEFVELTPKSVDEERHIVEVQHAIGLFLQKNFLW